tara:strand:+ start:930 stop:2399 length:1470 start_codon:yes stop_codon:yes gene_type:complete
MEVTREDIQAEIEKRQNIKDQRIPSSKTNVQSALDLVSGFPERVAENFNTRMGEVDQARENEKAGRISSNEMALQAIGKGAFGTVADVAGETVSTAVGAAADLYNPNLRQGFNDLMKGLVDSDAAKSAIDLYQGFDENTRKNVESIFNIANVMSPFKFKAKSGSGFMDTMREGTKVVDKATDMKRDMLKTLFQPPRSAKNIDFELRNGVQHVDKMVDDLLDVKGVSPLSTPYKNLQALNKHLDSIEARIQGSISTVDKPWSMKNVEKSFGNLVADTLNNAPSMRELGLTEAKKADVYASVMRKFKGITTNMKEDGINPNSLKGLLLSRRKLDKVLRDADFKKMTENQIGEIALEKQVVMEMRSKINEAVSGLVEQSGSSADNIKDLLKKQSSVFSAYNNLADRAALEAQNISEKGWLTRAFSTHPILVYSAMKHSNMPAAAALVLAAPSAIQLGGKAIGEAGRALAAPRVPLVRSGLFYGSGNDQQEQQ